MTGVLKFPENAIATLFLLPHGVCRSTGNFLLIRTLRRVANVTENLMDVGQYAPLGSSRKEEGIS